MNMARIALEEIAEELNELRNTGYKYDLPETYTKEELLTMFLIIEIQEINWSFRSLNENLQLLRRQLEHR